MKELKQLHQEDLARRRQTVARMPPQVLELPYKRSEMKEDWQRELEFAFEDMYNADNSKILSLNFQQIFKCFGGKIHLYWWSGFYFEMSFLFEREPDILDLETMMAFTFLCSSSF